MSAQAKVVTFLVDKGWPEERYAQEVREVLPRAGCLASLIGLRLRAIGAPPITARYLAWYLAHTVGNHELPKREITAAQTKRAYLSGGRTLDEKEVFITLGRCYKEEFSKDGYRRLKQRFADFIQVLFTIVPDTAQHRRARREVWRPKIVGRDNTIVAEHHKPVLRESQAQAFVRLYLVCQMIAAQLFEDKPGLELHEASSFRSAS